jgi:hypothetical protein
MREIFFFFFLNKSVRELNKGNEKVEVCGSSKSNVAIFEDA